MRNCTIDRGADVVVYTWGGAVIHIILLDTPFKARQIKKIIGENTRIGIGTLFLVDAAIMPHDGEKVAVDEGLLALHALFKDKVYTYRITNGVPHIGQVHFKSFGRTDEYEVWYGPDLQIRGLPFYRVWVKSPSSIKGEWLMANFGNEAFWRHADYTTGRDAFRQEQRRAYTYQATWSNATWNGGGQTTPNQNGAAAYGTAPKDPKLARSYSHLGVQHGASSEEVKAAFRKMARELHPDVSKLAKDEAENRFKILNEAYMYIKTKNGW